MGDFIPGTTTVLKFFGRVQEYVRFCRITRQITLTWEQVAALHTEINETAGKLAYSEKGQQDLWEINNKQRGELHTERTMLSSTRIESAARLKRIDAVTLELNAAKADVTRQANYGISQWHRAITAEGQVRELTKAIERKDKVGADLRARLEAAEAQLKYGYTSPCTDGAQFRTRDGAVYEYLPNRGQVLVNAREFEQLHAKATAYRNSGSAWIADDYPRPFSVNFNRDTIEITRNAWQDINDRIRRGDTFRRDVARELGVVEGEDIRLVAAQVKRTNISLASEKVRLQKLVVEAAADAQTLSNEHSSYKAIIAEIRKALGIKDVSPGTVIIARAEELVRGNTKMFLAHTRTERENTDLRSTLRQMNRTAQNQINTIANQRETLQSVLKTAEDCWRYDSWAGKLVFKGYDAANGALNIIKRLVNTQLATGEVGSNS